VPSRALPLADLLSLQRISPTELLGPASHEPHVRAFGGQVAAQAVVAAGHSVDPGRSVHSLHAYFLRPGRPTSPIRYRVDPLRDGRSFSVRRVTALQDDDVLLEMTTSFHTDERGVEHQGAAPEVPEPEALAPFVERFAGRDDPADMERWFVRAGSFDVRYVDRSPFEAPVPAHPAIQRVWFRYTGPTPPEDVVHAGILTYASDMTMLDAILLRHGMSWTDRAILGASLDHAMWFHRPVEAGEWLLFDQASPVAGGGRGFATAQVWDRAGRLVASIAQEALLRPPKQFA